jgi:hypothetical protein
MIEKYQFGSIKIRGKIYQHDVQVDWQGEVLKWWRKESHVIDVEDIKKAVERNPEKIVIGTGEAGVAEVTEAAQRFIRERKIELIIEKTGKVVEVFNQELKKQNKVIGLFHLTC